MNKVVTIHGGPGAAGEMKPVSDELRKDFEVLEPHQTAMSVSGQVEELKQQLEKDGMSQSILIGYSWGAWLGWILASKYPTLVKKMILVSAGPFEEKYASEIMKTRLKRLNDDDTREIISIGKRFSNHSDKEKNEMFTRFGQLMTKADSYKPLPDNTKIDFSYGIYSRVWPEAEGFRNSGKLLKMGTRITYPIIAIHGDIDPHPFIGVKEPLEAILNDFKTILLKNCGHKPWIEREAREEFYKVLRREIR
ncbi:alpha/beta hydrolase [Patescibacteria group bacterium]|nr:alpha/beta hydrolase [Patescibacteria group bacterium]MBU1891088.1 alpha/beta hydrolase [Patescibacteria group bacterium]